IHLIREPARRLVATMGDQETETQEENPLLTRETTGQEKAGQSI
uniref:Uncharacterized protein n=1 Tax=Fundulus heteroclitus TaxID=8078 RepID=A0A3Q2Q927_FUNHE